MKVVILFGTLFNQRDYQRFGIETLEANGFEVEVWCCTPFLYQSAYQRVKVVDPIKYLGHRLFQTKGELVTAINALPSSSWVISKIGFGRTALSIYRLLYRRRIRLGFTTGNPLPQSLHNSVGRQAKFWEKVKRVKPNKLHKSLFSLTYGLYIRFLEAQIRPACTFVVAAGANTLQHFRWTLSEQTDVLWAHVPDYDIYLGVKDEPTQVDDNVGVFLDSYMPFHPDCVFVGRPPLGGPDEYYPIVCSFFDWVEREHSVRVVIAAHPRSDYENHPDYFGGRPVIKNKTAKLIKQSRFVITSHACTAMNYVVLFGKPALFLQLDAIINSLRYGTNEGEMFQAMTRVLGKKPLTLHNVHSVDWEYEMRVDEAAYAWYRNAYIKRDGSAEKLFWQIVADYFHQMNDQLYSPQKEASSRNSLA